MQADRRAPWRVLFVLALVGCTVLALVPMSHSGEWLAQADKLRHVLAFATLGFIGLRAGWCTSAGFALLLLGYGVAIELAQSFTPSREASLGDVWADAAGIALALLAHQIVRRGAQSSAGKP